MSVSGNITLSAPAQQYCVKDYQESALDSRRVWKIQKGSPFFFRRINILEQPERVKKRALSALCTWRYSLVSRFPLLHHSVRIATASFSKLLAFPFLYPSISSPLSLPHRSYCPLALRFVRLLRLSFSSSLRLHFDLASLSLFLFEIKSYSENKGNVRTNALISIATIREARFPN